MSECPFKNCDCLVCPAVNACPLRKIMKKLEEIEEEIKIVKRRMP